MTYTIRLDGRHFDFKDLKTVMAKATPERSGDRLAGIAAHNDLERVAAQLMLADVPLDQFLEELLIPYEADEVTRLIVDISKTLSDKQRKHFNKRVDKYIKLFSELAQDAQLQQAAS